MLAIRRVVGPSMEPTYAAGTIVLGVGWLRPKPGDVVIARREGAEIIKRVARVDDRGYYLLGDNLAFSTDSRVYGWFTPDSIRSVVIGSIKA